MLLRYNQKHGGVVCPHSQVARLTLFISNLGRILKDENTIASYEITDGLTVHLVRGKTAAAAG